MKETNHQYQETQYPQVCQGPKENHDRKAKRPEQFRPTLYRMTIERAGLMFRAMKYQADACGQVSIQEIVDVGLELPDKVGKFPFAEFLAHNADRLQLYDEPRYARDFWPVDLTIRER
jgi:hypothetical protein